MPNSHPQLTYLSWQQFTHDYKFIKNINVQSSLYSPYSLYLNIQTKQKNLVKQILFQNPQELEHIVDDVERMIQTVNINNRSYLCKMAGLVVKYQQRETGRTVHCRQGSLHNKQGRVLLVFEYFKTLHEKVQSLLLPDHGSSYIEDNSDLVTMKNLPYFSAIIPEKTLLNILKTLISTVNLVSQCRINSVKSFTFQMIQIENFAEVDQKCKVFFYPFTDKDIAKLIWNEKFLIEDSYVGQKVLQTINRVETNEFTRISLQRNQTHNLSLLHNEDKLQESIFESLSQQQINQSLFQSAGMILLKLCSLALGNEVFLDSKYYKMSQNYELVLNLETINVLLCELKKNGVYSKNFIEKVEKLIYGSNNSAIMDELIKNLALYAPQKGKDPTPKKQRVALSIGKVPIKEKKNINVSVNLTPSKRIGNDMSKRDNLNQKSINQASKQQKMDSNPKIKSKSPSDSRSNSIIREKSAFITSFPKPQEFSLSQTQKNQPISNQKANQKTEPIHEGQNRNFRFSIDVNTNAPLQRKKFIEKLKQKILYDSNTGQLHENIISKQFRDGSTYLGQYNPTRNIKQGYGLYFYFDGDIYGGTWQNDQLNGLGIYYFANGDSYEGGVKNGQKDGFGVYNYGNGNTYKGEWKRDKKQGRGEFSYANGDKYIGDFVEGRKQGNGIYSWLNGDSYEGQFARNMKNGKGRLRKSATGDVIEGRWQNDIFIDKQKVKIHYVQSGRFYEGQVSSNGLIEGQGRYSFHKDSYYQGEFRNNRYEGNCVINYENGDIYQGQIINDLFDGQGEYYFAEKCIKYIGFWKQGKMHGTGQLIFLNQATIIETRWEDGVFSHHKATIRYNDGSKYEGDINQNGRHGRGRYFYRDGKWVDGQFDRNKLVHVYQMSM